MIQKGGGPCDDILNNFEPCDIIRGTLKVIVQYAVIYPLHRLVDIINFYIGRINELVWLILNFIIQVFSTIISIINGPIAAVNILTRELKELLKLSINLLTGDILSIAVVYTLPMWLYYMKFISTGFDVVIKVIMTGMKYLLSFVGINVSNNTTSFSYYHLLILINSFNIIAYLICCYGFIDLIF
jgi:hypothetical protein